MPEASLARELEIDYACCAVVANWAAGKQPGEITMAEIEANLRQGMADLSRILQHWVQS
jgi:purine nucleoside phosphorylase